METTQILMIKRTKNSNFYKNKKLSKIDDIDVNENEFLKTNHMVQKIHLKISLDIMMMVSLDYYA